MAATAKIYLKVNVDGLSDGDFFLDSSFTHTVTPAEVFRGYQVIGASAANLDLGGIAADDVLGVLIKAKVANCYILVNSASGTPTSADININAGEATYINLTGGIGESSNIRVLGSGATAAIEYLVFGKNT